MFCPNNEKQWGLKQQQTRVTFIPASDQIIIFFKSSPIQYDYNNNNNNKYFSFVDKCSNSFSPIHIIQVGLKADHKIKKICINMKKKTKNCVPQTKSFGLEQNRLSE